jgi:Resolvase, N terminal domain
MVGKAAVLSAIGNASTCTINALTRTASWQRRQHLWAVGCIAKSVNMPAATLSDPATGAFLPAAQLRAKFTAVGAFGKPNAIIYCGGGTALVSTLLDTTDLLIIARQMQKVGAGIRSLAEPFLDTTSDFADIVFAILGVAAKLERRRILERTARGRADAIKKGHQIRTQPKLTPHQQRAAIKRREMDGETLRSITRSCNVSPQAISRLAA